MLPSTNLVPLFLRLAAIDGVSLAERKIADEVTMLLRAAGVRVIEDTAGASFGGDTGNLICLPPGYRPDEPAYMLTAHLDTVKSTAGLRPIVDAVSVRSDGTTILGGDDRLGLSVLVMLLTEAARKEFSHANFFVLLSFGEELGLFGAGSANVAAYRPSCAYVFDCSKRPGVYIRESVGLYTFTAEFIGKTAHSGVAPEEGVSAIQLASRAIARLKLGRIDPETTANIGKIRGGEAVNAIPERVTIEGEVRSFTPERIAQELKAIEYALRSSMNGTGKLQFDVQPDFEPYILSANVPMISHLECAMRAVGLEPCAIRYTGGSDANKYNAKGVPAVNLGVGAQKPHSTDEFFLIEDMLKTYELARELVREDGNQP
jgi:tripeptide aminopeptidase